MTSSEDLMRNSFWEGSAPHLALAPQQAAPKGLLDFISAREATRSLLYFQTSGSEGVPKWVGLSRVAALASAGVVNAHLECTEADRWLISLPLHHVGGFSILARSYVSGASVSFLREKWDAGRFAEMCKAERITLTSLVPTQIYDLVTAKLEAPDGLRAIVVGGGAMTKELAHRALGLGWPVLQSYGMTEACSQIATEPMAHLHAGSDPDRLEVLPGWDLHTDGEGLLTIRGPSLASGYAVQREGDWTWDAIFPESGLRTRDRVSIWQHGNRQFLQFLGRESSFVKVKGELVSLVSVQRRIEGLMTQAPSAPQVVVCDLPHERKGTEIVLVVEKGDQDQHDWVSLMQRYHVDASAAEKLRGPLFVEAFPRTSLGKINVPVLREQIQAQS